MNSELANELKAAGWPQDDNGKAQGRPHFQTLEERIEACVDHISSLERCHNDDGEMEWSILVLNTCEHLRQKPRCCTGSPWLALKPGPHAAK
jgi:hypothetical protein